MAGNKFLKLSSGQLAEEASLQASAGVGDAGKIVALDATGKIDPTMMPTGIGAETKLMTTSEDLAVRDQVNIYDNSGTLTARKADASNGRRAHGYVVAGTTSGQNATVYQDGIITGLSGLTPGAPQYLSASVAGGITETPPTTGGHIVQEVGYAISDTEMSFNPQRPVTLA